MKIKDFGDLLHDSFVVTSEHAYEASKQVQENTPEEQTAYDYWKNMKVVREDTDTIRIEVPDGEFVVQVRRRE
jgi:hypothetical protein